MAIGPGKYDDLCTMVRERAKAAGAIVIVFNGEHGDGFAMQGDPRLAEVLPDLLESVAQTIRADLRSRDN